VLVQINQVMESRSQSYQNPGLQSTNKRLDSVGNVTENGNMEIQGRGHNGVVVLEGDPQLPEGMVVTVSFPDPPPTEPPAPRRRVSLPLVPSDRPGSLRLTAERVAELLEDDDFSA
jgi:hypothetical protein